MRPMLALAARTPFCRAQSPTTRAVPMHHIDTDYTRTAADCRLIENLVRAHLAKEESGSGGCLVVWLEKDLDPYEHPRSVYAHLRLPGVEIVHVRGTKMSRVQRARAFCRAERHVAARGVVVLFVSQEAFGVGSNVFVNHPKLHPIFGVVVFEVRSDFSWTTLRQVVARIVRRGVRHESAKYAHLCAALSTILSANPRHIHPPSWCAAGFT